MIELVSISPEYIEELREKEYRDKFLATANKLAEMKIPYRYNKWIDKKHKISNNNSIK